MKTTIAFHALMVAICRAAHSTAQQTSFVRGSMEEREEGKRQVWYDPIVEGAVAENSFILHPFSMHLQLYTRLFTMQ